jgi:hypothetical protein
MRRYRHGGESQTSPASTAFSQCANSAGAFGPLACPWGAQLPHLPNHVREGYPEQRADPPRHRRKHGHHDSRAHNYPPAGTPRLVKDCWSPGATIRPGKFRVRREA